MIWNGAWSSVWKKSWKNGGAGIYDFLQWIFNSGKSINENMMGSALIDTSTDGDARPIELGRCYDFDIDDFIYVSAPLGSISTVSALDSNGSIINLSLSYNVDHYEISGNGKAWNIKCWGAGAIPTEQQKKSYILEQNLFAWFKADEQAGNNAYDSTGNGNNGVLYNITVSSFHAIQDVFSFQNQFGYNEEESGVFIPRDESQLQNDVEGNNLIFAGRVPYNASLIKSNCAVFDGIDDYVAVGSPVVPSSGDFTISVWFRYEPVSTGRICAQGISGQAGRMFISSSVNGSNKIRFFVGGNTDLLVEGTTILSPGTVYHLFCIRNSDTFSIYINNILENSVTATSTVFISQNNFVIGANSTGGNNYRGGMWGFSVYEKSLTATERAEIYDNLINNNNNLILCIPFSEGGGSICHNISGNNNHGNMMGGSASFWGQQNNYHYNLRYGFRDNAGIFIPALLDNSAAADGGIITNPAGNFHNGSETKIDFSGGVASPFAIENQLPTDYSFGDSLPDNVERQFIDNKEFNFKVKNE